MSALQVLSASYGWPQQKMEFYYFHIIYVNVNFPLLYLY